MLGRLACTVNSENCLVFWSLYFTILITVAVVKEEQKK